MTRNTFLTGLAATLSLVGLAAGAHAQSGTLAQFSGTTPGQSDITFNGNSISTVPGGAVVMVTSTAAGPASINGFFVLPSLNLVSTNTSIPGLVIGNFGAGSFSIGSASGGNDLLQASFSGATLTGGSGSGSLFTLNNAVLYSSGTLRQTFLTTFGLPANFAGPVIGDISLSFTTLSAGAISATGNNINPFVASAFSGVASATAVPEPGEYAAMGMAGMSLLGLMGRARVRRRNAARTAVAA